MIFQSFEFAAFFAVAAGIFFLVPKGLRAWVLMGASALFFLRADPASGIWLLISVLSTWAAAIAVRRAEKKRTKKALLALCLLVNLCLLAMFKYLPVWEQLLNTWADKGIRVVKLDVAGDLGLSVPLGISFYTLQAVGYLIDVYRNKYEPQRSLLKYAVFVSFFPNLMSGPIERGDHFGKQLERVLQKSRRQLWCYDRIMQGLISILLGFFMKMVIADRAALLVDHLYGMYQHTNSFTMLMAALFYSVQIYCDFASYSCIAVGAARVFGFELTNNFRQPYFALGIGDFWRRWHISLSSWLRDYVYIPLGGSRRGALCRCRNLLLTFLVSGLWHGGAPVFLVWGALHGLLQILEDLAVRAAERCLRGRQIFGRSLWRLGGRLMTFLSVTCLWIFFRSDSVSMAAVCLKNLFTGWLGFLMAKDFLFVMGLNKPEMCVAVCAVLSLFVLELVSERKKSETAVWIYRSPLPVRWCICLYLILTTAVFGMYGTGFDPSGFIYVNF